MIRRHAKARAARARLPATGAAAGAEAARCRRRNLPASALGQACLAGHPECAKLLLAYGCAPRAHPAVHESHGDDRTTLLTLMTQNSSGAGQLEAARLLLQADRRLSSSKKEKRMGATAEYWQEWRQVVLDDNHVWATVFLQAGLHPDAEIEVRSRPAAAPPRARV